MMLLLSSCSSEKSAESPVTESYEDLTKEEVRKGLPIYPGAEIEKKSEPQGINMKKENEGEKTEWDDAVIQLGQGVENFSLVTEDDVRTINDFYEQAFYKDGWRRVQLNYGDGPKGNNAPMQMYEKGPQRITMMIRPHSSGKNKVLFILQDRSQAN